MTRYVCSKMFTDVNIRVPYNSVKNCCKTNDYVISDEELEELDSAGANILTQNAEYLRRKSSMIDLNELPSPSGCITCTRAEPHSLFRNWNIWNDENRPSNEDLHTKEFFTTYEFVLSSACDLKCVYCGAHDSSSWAKELGEPIRRGDPVWKERIINDVLNHLRTREYNDHDYWFFFSGGEPTYNPETLPLIEQIIELVPNDKLNIILSTNANTKPKVFKKYIDVVRKNKNVQWFFTCSIDSIGEKAEAIRYGIDWNLVIDNIHQMMKEPNIKVRIAPTINMYSIPDMKEYVKFFHSLFVEYDQVETDIFSFNMVQEPDLSPWAMPEQYASNLDDAIVYCDDNGLDFADHLRNVRKLIGTKINSRSSSIIEAKWNYFKARRPDMNWEELFPFVPEIIEELKDK